MNDVAATLGAMFVFCGVLIPLSRHFTLSGRNRLALTVRLRRPNPAPYPAQELQIEPRPSKSHHAIRPSSPKRSKWFSAN